MDYVLDVQGFQGLEDLFICKELAYSSVVDNSHPNVLFFEPPYHWLKLPVKYQSVNRWLEIYYHGILWRSGVIPYKILSNVLRNHLYNSRNIYVKGKDKKRWLQKILPEKKIVDLEMEMRCPPLEELTFKFKNSCVFHNQRRANLMCASINVQKLVAWVFERQKKVKPDGIDTVDMFTCDCNLFKNSSQYFETAMSTTDHKDYRQSILYSMYN